MFKLQKGWILSYIIIYKGIETILRKENLASQYQIINY